jgi:hypothetical protein
MIEIDDYKNIISDRNLFNQTVYTPLPEAIKLLSERQKDPEFVTKVSKLLPGNVPNIFKNKKCAIMARQLATPNQDSRTFISLAKKNGLHPVFLEYFDDKFTSVNQYKHSLGQLQIQNKNDKNNDERIEKISIIDFNKSNGKKIKEVKTLWGESLIDFHKKLFDLYKLKDFSFFEESNWYEKKNEKPIEFYINFFVLVTCFGILFENFLITGDDNEINFTKNVVLPALKRATILTGVKPLIVPVGDLDIETEDFWYYHLPIVKKAIKNI